MQVFCAHRQTHALLTRLRAGMLHIKRWCSPTTLWCMFLSTTLLTSAPSTPINSLNCWKGPLMARPTRANEEPSVTPWFRAMNILRLAFSFPWIIVPHQVDGIQKKQRRDHSSIENQMASASLLWVAPIERARHLSFRREKTGHVRASLRDCRHCQSQSQHQFWWQF